MNKIPLIILGLIAMIGVSILTLQPSCNSPTPGGVPQLEQMTDAQFTELKTWGYLTTKIAASRLVLDGKVPIADVTLAAKTLQTTANGQVLTAGTTILTDNLKKAGLTNDEITLALLVIETEIAKHGGFQTVNTGGVLTLAPHTKDLLLTISQALTDSLAGK